ncbi:GyrI-like domain-containing protein [Myceligenerans pegani]|uniref:GyrI-like domain-containing protein n=1 Tax=Myceligenerans pegani TaxID=2776917 RepID=A0ABR9MX32_9MICO|nr:GyrI-like domain-containing protein [Myceligenerans sp. TRM 65318]MBE1875953.1 GyrI-like domain-containing protein [Myceligenerans sp. TRM 65318]MBE3018224.1 GyrI-like domain-containing protein [Myceligenerans sp. TRM 65318]
MEIERGEREAQEIVGLRETVRMDDLAEFFPRAMTASAEALAERGIEPSGPAVALFERAEGDAFDVTAGFPVPPGAAPSDAVVAAMLPGGATVEAIHEGPYDSLRDAHRELTEWFRENGTDAPRAVWEEYLVGPETEDDAARWRTRLVYPAG